MNKIDLIIENIEYAKILKESAHQNELLEEALAAARELRDLKIVAKHVCNLWINPETSEYEVDRCTHPINEVIPVYTALAQHEQEHIECGYDETVGMCTNNPCCEQAQPEQAEWRKGFNAGYETANEQAEFKEIKQTEALEPIAWITDNYEQDRSATTFNIEVAKRWKEKGWRVAPLYALDEERS